MIAKETRTKIRGEKREEGKKEEEKKNFEIRIWNLRSSINKRVQKGGDEGKQMMSREKGAKPKGKKGKRQKGALLLNSSP